MDKKRIFLWTLYDFANSIVVIVFFLYFSQWLVIEKGVSDFWYNMIYVGASALFLLTAPVGGLIADKMGVRMPFIRILTVLMFIFGIVAGLIANFSPEYYIWAAVFYMLLNYFFQFSFTFYNPILKDISTPKKRGFVSGLGQAANWLGQISGLLITLPLASGAIILFGLPGRTQTFIPAVILFLLLSLPMLLLFRDKGPYVKTQINIIGEYKDLFHQFKELMKSPGIGTFLLGYFLFNDAVITAQNNFPIYMEQVFGISDQSKSILIISALTTSAASAFIAGLISDKIGIKRLLIIVLVGWTVFFPVFGLITSYKLFYVFTVIMGVLYGATWTLTRATMANLAPINKLNYSFSFYTLAERFSTFVGPITWGLLLYLLKDYGPIRYRITVASMSVFILLGLIIIRRIPETKKELVFSGE